MLKTKINLLEKISANKMAIALSVAFLLIAILAAGVLSAHYKIEKMQKIFYSNADTYGKISNFQKAGLEKSSAPENAKNVQPKKNHRIFSGLASGLASSGYSGQSMRDNIWLILGIKSIFLITLLAILFVLIKRSIKNLRNKKNKTSIHTVRQATKIRPRAIKKAKRK